MISITTVAVLALLLTDPAPVETTVAAVRADPEAFGSQTVRLRGEVNGCAGFDCRICPEEMTPQSYEPEACLSMTFDGFATETEHEAYSAHRLMEESFRFSVVTLTARVDPACLTNRPWPPEPPSTDENEIVEIVVCTDRASVLRDARVEAVHERHPANEGLPIYRLEALTSAPDIESVLIADFLAALPWHRDDHLQFAAFRPEDRNFTEAEDDALLCFCVEDDCTGRWPVHQGLGVLETPNNSYNCYWALKWDGRWRVYVD